MVLDGYSRIFEAASGIMCEQAGLTLLNNPMHIFSIFENISGKCCFTKDDLKYTSADHDVDNMIRAINI